MKSRVLLLFVSFAFIASIVNGQTVEPNIVFEKSTHDFGTIKELDGPVTVVFKFTNTGTKPLFIRHAAASCGCTTPEYTKDPVAPDSSGFIKVTYNPAGRPSSFTKTVTVTSNAIQPISKLTIKGVVEAKPRTLNDEFPFQMDDLRLKHSHVSFTKIKSGDSKTVKIIMVNQNKEKPLTVSFDDVPEHITISPSEFDINPEQKQVVEFTYNASLKHDWGFVLNYIKIVMNGVSDSKNRLTVSGTIEEDFSTLSPQELANAPVLVVEAPNFDFGTLKSGESVSHAYSIKNNGKSDLIIRKLVSSCGCTAVLPSKKVIAPGETASINAVFNSRGKVGKQYKTVTLITNSPKNPSVVLRITGMVNKVE